MLQDDDKVYIEDSAQIDVGFQSWSFVKAHPYATVKGAVIGKAKNGDDLPEREVTYALEFGEEFSGGIDCCGLTKPRCGQWITAKHLSLDFEASRKVVTVPTPKIDAVDMDEK